MQNTYPQTIEATLLVGNISADNLSQQHVTPPELGNDEYVASLCTSSPGAPSYVIGQRVSGKPYDRIIMNYGLTHRPWQQTWRLSADRGSQVDYQILHDPSSTGFASVER